MKDIKIIFFDIDGTLIDINKKQISEKMLETLHRLKEKNIILCIATGRPPLNLPAFKELFDVFLTFNGSYCFNDQQIIFSNPLDGKDVQKIIKNATGIGRPVSIATKERMVSNGKEQDLIDYYSIANREIEVEDDFDVIARQEVYQMMMGGREEEYSQILDGVQGARITAWWDRAVDIISCDGGKGRGVEAILEYYHLSKEDAVAFGDGNNDIELLQAVGQGVAMGNASDQLKAVADDICGSAADDGIYFYCLEHGFI